MPDEDRAPPGPVRLTLLTGFLGAGKTTLLNRMLRDPALRDTAVIVNEFGEVGIDHLLVESSGEEIIELSDGCVCCSVRGDLVETLIGLPERMKAAGSPRPERVVIETTGLADPSPILASLMAHPVLVATYALGSVLVVVDASGGVEGIEGRLEAERQIACADRIVLSKRDLREGALDPAMAALFARLNPTAPTVEAMDADIASLVDAGLYDPARKAPNVARWLGEAAASPPGGTLHRHAHGSAGASRIGSVSLIEERAIAQDALGEFLALLGQTQGARLLRMKAVVRTAEDPDRPLVLHGVRGHLHPPVRLPAWPEGAAPQSRLVLIGEGLDADFVRDLFAAFTGRPRVDAPDREAILHNPLAPAGLRLS